MKMPNAERAVVELIKLTDYCLNPRHPRGRHKARVFAARTGITADDAELLREALLEAARTSQDAVPGEKDGFGRRYVLDFDLTGPKATATARSTWIVQANEDYPRLATCYLL